MMKVLQNQGVAFNLGINGKKCAYAPKNSLLYQSWLKGYKLYKKPVKIEIDEWYYRGCFIQKQNHPKLPKYHVFKDTENQEIIDGCYTFNEAKKLCELNEVKNPLNGLKAYL